MALVALVAGVAYALYWKQEREQLEQAKAEISAFWSGRTDTDRFYVSTDYTSPDAYIAHGGGIKDYVWSNSLEAVRDSLQRGFKFVELDLLVTTDGHVVAGHKWKDLRKFTGVDVVKEKPMAYDEIINRKVHGKDTVLDGKGISKLMEENPDFILVVDRIEDYGLLVKEIPFPDRMIVETHTPELYAKAIRAGIKYPAYMCPSPKAIKTAREFAFPIVTVKAGNFFDDENAIAELKKLHDDGVTLMMFGKRYDTAEIIKKHLGKTVSKIYTDDWSPTSLP